MASNLSGFTHKPITTELLDDSHIWIEEQSKTHPTRITAALLKQPNAASSALVPVYLYGTPQAISDAGAASITVYKTDWTTTGVAAGTLADGTIVGQMKLVQLIVDAGTLTLTPSNFADGTSIAFADAGDCALLQWDGTNWNTVDLFNRADGATAPAVS